MAEAKGFRWLFLHPVHSSGSSGSRAPVPWRPSTPDKRRHESLLNLLQHAFADEELSILPSKAKSETKPSFLEEAQLPILSFSGGYLQGLTESGDLLFSVPLLMADLVYLSASSRSEAVQKGEVVEYLLALAPRPSPSSATNGVNGDEVPLEDVWLMYTQAAESSDFLRLLFQFGSRGALRWDLQNCYTLTERALGSGGCGTVYLGQSRMHLPAQKESAKSLDMPAVPQVAIKKLNKSGGLAEEASIRSEIEFLAVAKGHPNITALFGVFCYHEEEDAAELPRARWCIVMSLYSAGDLFDYLAANGAMPEPAAVTLMLCLLSALTHLHRLGVVHRDVKAENILLASSKAVLSDLGIAAFVKDEEAMQKRVGSPGYAPPEVVTDLPYDEKVDVFGSGAVLYFALSNTLPFPGKSLKKVLELTAKCKVRYDPTLFGEYGGSIMQLLKALLQKDPAKRPSAKKSFLSLWTLAKPDVRNSSAAKAAYQAVEDFDKHDKYDKYDKGKESKDRHAHSVLSALDTSVSKVLRTSSQQDLKNAKETKEGQGQEGKDTPAATADPKEAGKVADKSEKSLAPDPTLSDAGAKSTNLEPKPPSSPKPESRGSFSFWKTRLGWGKSTSAKDGESSQGMR